MEWVAVGIRETHNREQGGSAQAEKKNRPRSFTRGLLQDAPENKPERHDPRPGNQRIKIEPKITGARRDERTGHMKQSPEQSRHWRHRGGADGIKRVMSEHQDRAEDPDRPERQINQRRHQDHGETRYPDYLDQEKVRARMKGEHRAHHHQLEGHEPEPATDEEPRQLRARFAERLEINGSAREKNKGRGAEMSDPASEEYEPRGRGRVRRV